MPMTRRQLLKTGVAGGALLAIAGFTTKGTFWGAGSRRLRDGAFQYQFLTAADRTVLQAIVPVILTDVFTDHEGDAAVLLEETIRGVDIAISGFYPAVQAELRQLFSLLTLPPGRMLVAGVWRHWTRAGKESIESFLNSWRTSRFNLFQTGYDALQQLVAAAWYGNPKSWQQLGYPGPPNLS